MSKNEKITLRVDKKKLEQFKKHKKYQSLSSASRNAIILFINQYKKNK
jgi:hypothetical protein